MYILEEKSTFDAFEKPLTVSEFHSDSTLAFFFEHSSVIIWLFYGVGGKKWGISITLSLIEMGSKKRK